MPFSTGDLAASIGAEPVPAIGEGDTGKQDQRGGEGALTAAEARQVRGWIRDKRPEQLKLPYVLWTAGVVRELIWRRLHKRLRLPTVHLYLRRWEFTPQKPLTRATQRSDAAIAAWLKRDYPKIARRAQQEQALIYWGDETGISNQVYAAVRRFVFVEGAEPSGGGAGFGLNRETVAKICRFSVPPGYRPVQAPYAARKYQADFFGAQCDDEVDTGSIDLDYGFRSLARNIDSEFGHDLDGVGTDG